MLRILNTVGSSDGRGSPRGLARILPGASRRARVGFNLVLVAGAAVLSACTTLPQDPVVTPPAPTIAAHPAGGTTDARLDRSTGTVYQPLAPHQAGKTTGDGQAPLDEIARLNLAKRDLWGRIRAGFAMPDLDTPLVAQKEKFYLDRPEYLQRMFDRGSRYLYYIVDEIEKRGLPTELALLPFVESAMNPVAMSSAKAAGLWQFIPSTGKAYDLSQNWWVDNRRDVVQSTRAALDYLEVIYKMHGNDWFLALASYNWGEGAVGRAVKKNKARGKPADYLSLSMPNETRHYVPKLIALKHIVMQADELGLNLPDLPDRAYFVTVEKTRPIDLKLAAAFAEMSVADFVALNPAHNRPVIAASENNILKIPADKIDAFTAAIARHELEDKVFASWQPYTLKPGESIDTVARRGGITPLELLQANSISPAVKVLAGTRILAPLKNVEDESQVEGFAGARVYQLVNVPAQFHAAQRRDTSATIARRYGVTVSQLTAMNGNLSKLRAGTRVMVRRATTQTVLVTETGNRQIVRSQEPVMVRASSRPASTDASVETVTLKPKIASARASKQRAARPAARPVARPPVKSSAARSKTPVRVSGSPSSKTSVKPASSAHSATPGSAG